MNPFDQLKKPTKHRVGSRAWQLAQLSIGEALLVDVGHERSASDLMASLRIDGKRAGIEVTQTLIYGVAPGNPYVHNIIRVKRIA